METAVGTVEAVQQVTEQVYGRSVSELLRLRGVIRDTEHRLGLRGAELPSEDCIMDRMKGAESCLRRVYKSLKKLEAARKEYEAASGW